MSRLLDRDIDYSNDVGTCEGKTEAEARDYLSKHTGLKYSDVVVKYDDDSFQAAVDLERGEHILGTKCIILLIEDEIVTNVEYIC